MESAHDGCIPNVKELPCGKGSRVHGRERVEERQVSFSLRDFRWPPAGLGKADAQFPGVQVKARATLMGQKRIIQGLGKALEIIISKSLLHL